MPNVREFSSVVDRRYDFVLLFDVTDGNPNGDPDAGNLPRIDPQTLQGLVTDVCIKRKIRNAVAAIADNTPRNNLYFQTQDAVYEKRILNLLHQEAYEKLAESGELADEEANPKAKVDNAARARAWMCEHFYDVRCFGAVMSTGVNCGQVRGPVQITFARSLDPIIPAEFSIARASVTTEAEAEKQSRQDGRLVGTMGRKSTVSYALYRGYGFVNPLLAKDTGFTYADLRLMFDSLLRMFDFDRSASRGWMVVRKLVVFEHENRLGNAPTHMLFDRVQTSSLGAEATPRQFSEYAVEVNREDLPAGISMYELPEELEELLPRKTP